ncbi:hypothetical protein BKA65DRAFT_479871 [Rhexocercosporidium sp. MPI-PUGE-AT-0058]|nr:hypothetical protein BKA65DRAFT_479871 [Rhexocercosporidium sp. MPI-PUGE-AT-0058]
MLADEKVAMEVETLSRIHEETDIPVPRTHGWGLAKHNPLGLGPFIVMDFIEGVSLESILKEKADKRLMRGDISDSDIEYIYRQFAQVPLKLFQLDFDYISNLPTPTTGFQAPVRPLTFKVYDIIQLGGVNTFGDRSKGFASTTEYFLYVFNQDWEQLIQQSNCVAGEYDARAKLSSFKALRALRPDFVRKDYDRGPFKLLCDDFGLANMIVRSKDDLTIVGVVDLEWSYAERVSPVSRDSQSIPQIPGDLQASPEEEEEQLPGRQSKKLSSLVEWSQASGAMWFHILLQTGFNYVSSIPFAQLRKHIGTQKWEKVRNGFLGTKAINALVTKKTVQLDQYNEALEQIRNLKYRVDNGDTTEEDFIKAIAAHC